VPSLREPADPTSQLREFLARDAEGAEIVTHRVRLAILLLVELRLAVFAWPDLMQGRFKHWFTLIVILVGAGLSVRLVRAVIEAREKDPWLVASTALDALLGFVIVVPSVLWPRPGYVGALAAPDFGIWPVIATGAGLRLSRRAAAAGASAAMIGVLVQCALDRALNAEQLAYGIAEIGLAIVLMLGATLLALALDARIRRLVAQGAEEARRGERARSRLGAYVSEEVAELVLREPDALPGGVEQPVAVVFSDIRGFTRTGQDLPPDQLIAELNEYLEAMVGAIRENGGVVDKYMGDAILAVFGIPTRTGDEAIRAIRTARRMEQALALHNAERERRGKEPLKHGIGVHYGRVAAGNVGTRERLQYTVIGDTVNVASRLQTASKEVGCAVVLSDTVVARAREEGDALLEVRPLPPIELRGRVGKIAVHTLPS
jgi:class 3 adenylate cyclase